LIGSSAVHRTLELDGAAEHHHGHVAGSSAERRHQVFAGGVTSANTILR